MRSVLSGGSSRLRSVANSKPQYQVGDLAPNGPQGEFLREAFGIECKNYGENPDWWHVISSEAWIVEGWWDKIKGECAPFNLQPLLVMLRNFRPEIVMMNTSLCETVHQPQLIIPRLGAAVITMKEFQSHFPLDWVRATQIISPRLYVHQKEVTQEGCEEVRTR